MGSGPSKASASATQIDQIYGNFKLTDEQARQNQVMSKIFQYLLSKNNLLDLNELVSEDRCKNTIAVLSSEINKEFTSLKFADLANPNKLSVVSFIGQEHLKALKNNELQRQACNDIAEFLVRFVLLVGAMVSSISIPSGSYLPKLLKSDNEIATPDIVDEVKERLEAQNKELLSSMKFLNAMDSEKSLFNLDGEFILSQDGYIFQETKSAKTKLIGFKLKYVSKDFDKKIHFNDVQTKEQINFETRLEEEKEARIKMLEEPEKKLLAIYDSKFKTYIRHVEKTDLNLKSIYSQMGEILRDVSKRSLYDNYYYSYFSGYGRFSDLQSTISELQSKLKPIYNKIINYRSEKDIKKLFDDINKDLPDLNIKTQINIGRYYFIYAQVQAKDKNLNKNLNKNEKFIKASSAFSAILNDLSDVYDISPESSLYDITATPEYKALMNSIKDQAGGRRTRKNKKIGGAEPNQIKLPYYHIEFTDIVNCSGDVFSSGLSSGLSSASPTNVNIIKPLQKFTGVHQQEGGQTCDVIGKVVFNLAGEAWPAVFFEQNYMKGMVRSDNSRPFIKFIRTTFDKILSEVDIEQSDKNDKEIFGRRRQSNVSTNAAKILNPRTERELSDLNTKIQNNTVLSPAAHRAIMLITKPIVEKENRSILTSFCKGSDPWLDFSLKEIPAYGLFESLFYNRNDPDSVDSEKDKFISYLESKNILNVLMTTESKTDFDKRRFADPTAVSGSGLKAFCDKQNKAIDNKHPALIALLKDAYGKLRTLYTQHVSDVYKFMQSIFVIDADLLKALNLSGIEYSFIDPTKSVIRLNPFFVSHANGSMVALSEKIAEGRKILIKHYAAVEQTYKDALDSLDSGFLGSKVIDQTSDFRK
jgi:hypothetical protein